MCLFKLCSTAVHNWNCTFLLSKPPPKKKKRKKEKKEVCWHFSFFSLLTINKKNSLDVEHHCYRIIKSKTIRKNTQNVTSQIDCC